MVGEMVSVAGTEKGGRFYCVRVAAGRLGGVDGFNGISARVD